MTDRELVGYVDVDAGLIMIGDPCYTLPEEGTSREELGKDWSEFCDRLGEEESEILKEKGINEYPSSFDPETGKVLPEQQRLENMRAVSREKPLVYHPWKKHVNAAVVTSTGFGDGTYPVYVEYYEDGLFGKRVKSITVEFIGDDEE